MSGSVSLVNGHIDPDKKRITDKQIIQALNTATNVDGLQICCIDYENNPKNVIYLSIKGDILDLINRQQAEQDELFGKNEQLKAKNKAIMQTIADVRTEAIEEFWGRLKGIAYQSGDWSHGEHPMVVELDDAEEIYDEMVGEQE